MEKSHIRNSLLAQHPDSFQARSTVEDMETSKQPRDMLYPGNSYLNRECWCHVNINHSPEKPFLLWNQVLWSWNLLASYCICLSLGRFDHFRNYVHIEYKLDFWESGHNCSFKTSLFCCTYARVKLDMRKTGFNKKWSRAKAWVQAEQQPQETGEVPPAPGSPGPGKLMISENPGGSRMISS